MGFLERLFLPPQASTHAKVVDDVFIFVTWVNIIFFLIVAAAAVWFCIKYKRRGPNDRTPHVTHNLMLELVWSIIPLFIVMVIFFWGFQTYMVARIAPNDSFEIQATAKKWLWAFEYPDGTRSINELHVPFGRPVRVILSSEDVLHAFFLKDFRVKTDVLPNRYTEVWFEATKPGVYDLQCAEYCGKDHSKMLGKVYVELGKMTYEQAGCVSCHSIDGTKGQGPSWKGIYGATHKFTDGTSQVVDENYIRESIENPQGKIVTGFEGIMPTYQGLLREKQINGVIAYIKSLK
jgi:cytochrome c oxidase subunit 2